MHGTLLVRWSMVLTINIMHEHGLINKLQPQLQPKKSTIRLYHTAAKGVMHAIHY